VTPPGPLTAVGPSGRRHLRVTSDVGRGGEGTVHRAEADPAFRAPHVVKLYFEPASRADKVAAMVATAPGDPALVWPDATVHDASGRFVGYTMPELPDGGFRPWAVVAHPADRRREAPDFDLRYAYAAARNLAVALNAAHRAGHVVGDVNESNVLVGADATVRIVDCDSAQVRGPDGTVHACGVAKEEFLAPELYGPGPLAGRLRTTASDTFAYAVLVYQLLSGGAHPTDGVPAGPGDPPPLTERVRVGAYPALVPVPGLVAPARVPAMSLPGTLRQLLLDALSPDPARRPTLGAFVAELDRLAATLVRCEAGHYHEPGSRCGWCAHATTQPDPWGLPSRPRQQALDPLSFGDAAPPPPPPRAAPAPPPGGATGVPPALSSIYGALPPAPTAAPPPPPPPGLFGAPRSMVRLGGGPAVPRPSLWRLAAEQPVLAARLAWQEAPAWLVARAPQDPGAPATGPARPVAVLVASAVLVATIALLWRVLGAAVAIGLWSSTLGATAPPSAARPAAGVLAASALASAALLTASFWRTHGYRRLTQRATWADTGRYVVAALTVPVLVLGAATAAVVAAVAVLIARMVSSAAHRRW